MAQRKQSNLNQGPGPSGHIPVLLQEVVAGAKISPTDWVLDATFGRGGYSRALLEAGAGRVTAFDRDPEAASSAEALAREFSPRFEFRLSPFSAIADLANEPSFPGLDVIVFDLGISSPQVDQAERGFSFQHDGPLDMRMGLTGPSAADLVNSLKETELADLIYHLGEERKARQIAKAIVLSRAEAPLERTDQLAKLVASVVPRHGKTHPATLTFQALRLAVNNELGELVEALGACGTLLKPGGRLLVVSFHSLEDRLVKHFLRRAEAREQRDPITHAPLCAPTFVPSPRKAIQPGKAELRDNPRSRSARLRIAARTQEPFRDVVLPQVWSLPDVKESKI